MNAEELFREALRRGLSLRAAGGDRLGVKPTDRLTPDFAEQLRQHKAELLALLSAKAHPLTPDCVPWLHIARQVLNDEFAGADHSTVQSLTIGLLAVNHPICKQAAQKLGL